MNITNLQLIRMDNYKGQGFIYIYIYREREKRER